MVAGERNNNGDDNKGSRYKREYVRRARQEWLERTSCLPASKRLEVALWRRLGSAGADASAAAAAAAASDLLSPFLLVASSWLTQRARELLHSRARPLPFAAATL